VGPVYEWNTDTQDIYADASSSPHRPDRYTIGGLYKSSEDDNVQTEDKKLGYMKYDHFFTKKWYGYAIPPLNRTNSKISI